MLSLGKAQTFVQPFTQGKAVSGYLPTETVVTTSFAQ